MEQLTRKLLGLPELASVHGDDVDRLIVYVHYLMIVLFVGWTGYFLYTLWRFRKGRNPKADYVGVTSHASSYLELAVAAVEVILLVGFAVPLWAKVVDKFPSDQESQMVRVTGQQFAWSARYPGGMANLASRTSNWLVRAIRWVCCNSTTNSRPATPMARTT
jgi:cytochrome c oxidase subunit II